ncbi:MAG: SMC-Scp complex subunit ScpB [Alphaproteobacteria bacterium]|nr:SMC-Scp complex subunit ScpB [Alphaproteobacteria bacterium]
MVPPKLKLVKNADVDNDNVPTEADRTSPEAVELAAALTNARADLPGGYSQLSGSDHGEQLRIIEAVIFAAPEPVDEATLKSHLSDGADIAALLQDVQTLYADRGVHLVKVAGKWTFRTADDLAFVLQKHAKETRRLSKAALETLAIIAYHQPVTRAEIEEVRGVTISTGTLDILMETGWVRPRGRRRAPGKPITYGTSEAFLSHFSLENVQDLPGLRELKAAGLLDSTLPPGFEVPSPTDVAALMPDELPLDAADDEEEFDDTDDCQELLAFETDDDDERSDGEVSGNNDSDDDLPTAPTALMPDPSDEA